LFENGWLLFERHCDDERLFIAKSLIECAIDTLDAPLLPNKAYWSKEAALSLDKQELKQLEEHWVDLLPCAC